jgi:hypothetical protein
MLDGVAKGRKPKSPTDEFCGGESRLRAMRTARVEHIEEIVMVSKE